MLVVAKVVVVGFAPKMADEKKQFFPGVHALRFVAASLVVIEHAGATANDYSIFGVSIIIPHVYYGRIGVILFFAISGFVIALQRTRPVGDFVAHRFLRIYPSYWVATVLAAALLFCAIGRAAGFPSPWAASLIPTSTAHNAFTIPYWTLVFEVVFYALAAIAFGLRLSDRTLAILAVAWIAAVNVFGVNAPDSNAYAFPGWSILLSPAVQVFPLGLICGIYFEQFRRAGRWIYLGLAVVSFVAGFRFAEFSTLKLLFDGLSASFMVLAVADLGQSMRRAVEWLGNTSYGIYLLHFPAITAAAAVMPGSGLPLLLAVGIVAGILFGWFDHWFYRRLVQMRHATLVSLGSSLKH